MKEIITKVYTFEELSDKAKEKAIEWFRSINQDEYWSESVCEDARAIAKLMGIQIEQIYFRGFSSQGDGACFEGSFKASDVKIGEVQRHAPKDARLHSIAKDIEYISKENPLISFRVKHRGHYYHEDCTEFDVDFGDGEGQTDNKGNPVQVSASIIHAAKCFMEWIYETLEKEWTYQNSEEIVKENITANEYTFTENGKRFG